MWPDVLPNTENAQTSKILSDNDQNILKNLMLINLIKELNRCQKHQLIEMY